MKNEYINGYKVIRAVCFDDGNGFAIGKDDKAKFPLTAWQFTEKDDTRIYFCGYYFRLEEADTAQREYERRITKYVKDNPGIQEKYNYLAAAEMSGEDNYNQIDGIPNNTTNPTFEKRMKDENIMAHEHNSLKYDQYNDVQHSEKFNRHKLDRHKKGISL